MTRKEETVQAANQREKEVGFTQRVKDTKGVNSAYGIGFLEGAEWADKTMLDRVCEWLKENATFHHPRKERKVCMINLTAFKQAMEE